MAYDLDFQILLHIIPELPEDVMDRVEGALAESFDEYMRFREICEIINESKGIPQKKFSEEDLKKSWRQYTRLDRNRFDELIDFYFLRYKERAKKKGRKGTVTELNVELSGHNKWYRMLRDHGMGKQYHDDIRKLCFIFQLSYTEAVELLWSAGQPLSSEDARDYVIAECLVKKVYKQEEINKKLQAMKQAVLF